jgi:hypothetical protein
MSSVFLILIPTVWAVFVVLALAVCRGAARGDEATPNSFLNELGRWAGSRPLSKAARRLPLAPPSRIRRRVSPSRPASVDGEHSGRRTR